MLQTLLCNEPKRLFEPVKWPLAKKDWAAMDYKKIPTYTNVDAAHFV